jgi:hypothetical protein
MKNLKIILTVLTFLFGIINTPSSKAMSMLTTYTNTHGRVMTKSEVIIQCNGFGGTCAIKYTDNIFYSYFFFT